MATAHRPRKISPEVGDDVAWARRINARWIVHGGLDDTAAAYMDRLESTDRRRLALSCGIARALTGKAGAGEDPKAWFYAGLFSMAEPFEVAEFLLGHRLITTVLFADPVAESPGRSHPPFTPPTCEMIRRIRSAIAQLSLKKADMNPAGPRTHP